MLRWILGIDRVGAVIESKCLTGIAIEGAVEVGRGYSDRGGAPAKRVGFMLSVLLDVSIHGCHLIESCCRDVAGRAALMHRKQQRQNGKQEGQ